MNLKLYQEIKEFLKRDEIPEKVNSDKEIKKWKRFCIAYQATEGTLYWKAKWSTLTKVVKYGETDLIIFLYHNDPLAGHLGTTKIMQKIKA